MGGQSPFYREFFREFRGRRGKSWLPITMRLSTVKRLRLIGDPSAKGSCSVFGLGFVSSASIPVTCFIHRIASRKIFPRWQKQAKKEIVEAERRRRWKKESLALTNSYRRYYRVRRQYLSIITVNSYKIRRKHRRFKIPIALYASRFQDLIVSLNDF